MNLKCVKSLLGSGTLFYPINPPHVMNNVHNVINSNKVNHVATLAIRINSVSRIFSAARTACNANNPTVIVHIKYPQQLNNNMNHDGIRHENPPLLSKSSPELRLFLKK